MAEELKLTTAAELADKYDHTKIVKTNANEVYELRAIPSDDFTIGYVNHINFLMIRDGLDPKDVEVRTDFITKLPASVQQDLLTEYINDIRNNICKSIQNVHFVNEKQSKCKIGQRSIDDISDVDLEVLWVELQELSLSPEDREEINRQQERAQEILNETETVE